MKPSLFCLPLQKDALQWSRNLSVPEGEELEDTADAESCESNEASTVSGDNDGKCRRMFILNHGIYFCV